MFFGSYFRGRWEDGVLDDDPIKDFAIRAGDGLGLQW